MTFTSSSGSPYSGIWDRIYFGSGSNTSGCIIDNCEFEYADEGIYCYYADLDITNSTFDICDNGLYLYDSENKLTNVSVTRSDEEGIESRYGTLNVYDCYLDDNDYDALYLYYGDGFSMDNTTITNASGYNGVEFYDTDYGYINNSFIQNCQRGIYDNYCYDDLLIKDTIFYTNSYSVQALAVDNLRMFNNTFHDDSTTSLYIGPNYKSLIANCTIIGSYRGIEVSGNTDLIIRDTNVDFTYQGFDLIYGTDVTFINCTASGSTGNSTLYVDSSSSHPVLVDCDLTSTATNEVCLMNGADLTLVNCTFDTLETYINHVDSTLYKMEYFDVKVTNQTHTSCPNALYTVTDNKDMIVASGNVDATGCDKDVLFTELEMTFGPDYDPNPYTVQAMQDTGWWTESGKKTTSITEDDDVEVKMNTDSNLIIWATDHVLTSNEEYENVTIIAMGNVTIPGPWYLGFLNNVTLLMKHDVSLEKGIGLSGNGALNWTNSSISSIGSDPGGKKTKYYFDCQNSIIQWHKVNITHFDDDGMVIDSSWANIYESYIHGEHDGIDSSYTTFNVHNTKFWGFNMYALDLIYCDNSNFTWCDLWDVEYAFDLYYCDQFTAHNNTVTNGYRAYAYYYGLGPSEFVDCDSFNVDYHFYIYDSDDVNLTRCTAKDEDLGTSYGFYVRDYSTNIIIRDCLATNLDYGYDSDDHSHLYLHDSRALQCTRGAYVDYSYFYGYNLTVSGSTYAFDTESYTDQVYLFNCSLSSTNQAFMADDGRYVIENSTLTTTGGLRVVNGVEAKAWFYNTTINNLGATYDLYLDGYSSDRLEFYMINCSWDDSSIYFADSYCTVYKQNFFRIFVQNSSGGVDGAEYSVVDDNDQLLYSGKTDAAGFSDVSIFTEKIITSSGTTLPGQYTVRAYNYIGNQVELGDKLVTLTAGMVVTVDITLDPSYMIWTGDHVLTSNESYRDVKIIAMGNVVVPAPWWLAFETNVTLYMKHDIDYRKGIEILDGGFFNCTGSNITSIGISAVRPATYYRFWVGKTTGARLNLSYSNITRLGSLGIRINDSETEDIRIWESEFYGNEDCLYFDNSGALIWNTTFTDTNDEVLSADNSDHIQMWGCDFNYFDDAVVLDFSDWVNITGCYFNDGFRDGTCIDGYYTDNINVTDCSFYNCDHGVYNIYGLVYTQDNYFQNTDYGAIYSGSSSFLYSYNDDFYQCDYGPYGAGWTNSDMIVKEATIDDCGYGIYHSGIRMFVENITITNTDYSVRLNDNTYFVGRNITTTNSYYYALYSDWSIGHFYDCSFDAPVLYDTIYCYYHSDLNLTNCSIASPVSAADYAVSTVTSATARLTNCTVSTAELESTSATCPIYVLSEVDIKCRLNSGNPYPGANVTVKDNYGKVQQTLMSGTGGWSRNVPVLHYQELNYVGYNSYNNINFTAQDYGHIWSTFTSVTSFKVVYITISDNVDPVSTLTIGTPKHRFGAADLWNVSGSTTFTLSATDFFTGVDDIYYQVDTGSWNTYSTPFTLNSYAEGERRIRYYAEDMDGNTESTTTLYVVLDKSSPSSTINIGDPKYRGSMSDRYNITSSTQISLGGTDPAGISNMFYRIDGAGWVTYGTPFMLSSFAEGIHTIEANARDNLG
ncbi:MAG: right-handed parallel beta-helix repeat-containing protein, partial [Methanosarcinaceae archaeon]